MISIDDVRAEFAERNVVLLMLLGMVSLARRVDGFVAIEGGREGASEPEKNGEREGAGEREGTGECGKSNVRADGTEQEHAGEREQNNERECAAEPEKNDQHEPERAPAQDTEHERERAATELVLGLLSLRKTLLSEVDPIRRAHQERAPEPPQPAFPWPSPRDLLR